MSKFVVVLDLNDTVTLLNAVDADKSISVVLNQLVAQNVYTVDGSSVEQYIKDNIPIKKDQRKTYEYLPLYVNKLLDNNIMSYKEYLKVEVLHKIYTEAWEKTSSNNGGFFNSCFKLLDYLLEYHPNTCIQVQSFGGEIPKFLAQIKKSYPDLPMRSEILDFSQCLKYQILEKVEENSIPGYVTVCKNDYNLWQNEGFGKPVIFGPDVTTVIFDDNVYRCATVIEKDENGDHKKLDSIEKRFEKYFFKVDTASALLDENYFVNLIKQII